jgi:hypothetical protein
MSKPLTQTLYKLNERLNALTGKLDETVKSDVRKIQTHYEKTLTWYEKNGQTKDATELMSQYESLIATLRNIKKAGDNQDSTWKLLNADQNNDKFHSDAQKICSQINKNNTYSAIAILVWAGAAISCAIACIGPGLEVLLVQDFFVGLALTICTAYGAYRSVMNIAHYAKQFESTTQVTEACNAKISLVSFFHNNQGVSTTNKTNEEFDVNDTDFNIEEAIEFNAN